MRERMCIGDRSKRGERGEVWAIDPSIHPCIHPSTHPSNYPIHPSIHPSARDARSSKWRSRSSTTPNLLTVGLRAARPPPRRGGCPPRPRTQGRGTSARRLLGMGFWVSRGDGAWAARGAGVGVCFIDHPHACTHTHTNETPTRPPSHPCGAYTQSSHTQTHTTTRPSAGHAAHTPKESHRLLTQTKRRHAHPASHAAIHPKKVVVT